ncbi:cathepsin L [Strigomonas culicis]|uniref:Cathepsin L n=1 Tax=Strigomonas culicis TaxID=28005 RepID=S9WG30_9TRYP|nr:cathepsin L [Strigomonas culicis]EPY34685.1 cathepsin L [Strigomonas culicis]|eukprot:EPY25881.1 cathepsin L [Strigomonas culicis]
MRFFCVATLVLLALVASVEGWRVESRARDGLMTFEAFIKQFNKDYSPSEYVKRKQIFEANVVDILKHNSEGHSYYKGINEMSDWTHDEFMHLNAARGLMKQKVTQNLHDSFTVKQFERTNRSLPHRVDYRRHHPPILTSIKNQGNCGSCWAHSAVEAIESHWALATGNLHVLSQQQITSCTPNPNHCGGTGGCSGSVEQLAFAYIHDAGGIAEEWSYPYTSYYGDSGVCKSVSPFEMIAKVKGYVEVAKDDQEALMEAVAYEGPISVSVDATYWQSYAGGIFNGCNYSLNITQNHAVQLVGYGFERKTNQHYWLIRNSWGPRWGEHGYMRLLRTRKPECGWDVNTHMGSACDGDPDTEWVCGTCGILTGASYPIPDVGSFAH